jgi:hypothetical protein
MRSRYGQAITNFPTSVNESSDYLASTFRRRKDDRMASGQPHTLGRLEAPLIRSHLSAVDDTFDHGHPVSPPIES